MLLVKKLDEKAIIPKYETTGAACFDLTNCVDTCIAAGQTQLVRTGLAIQIPKDHVMLIYPRSGMSLKYKNYVANNVGVIDSDYRGEVMIPFVNNTNEDIFLHYQTRMAQAMIVPVKHATIFQAWDLSETERGAGGFGSTGETV